MLQNDNWCNLCKEREVKILLYEGKSKIVKCRKCGLIFRNPLPSLNDIKIASDNWYKYGSTPQFWYENRLPIFKNNLKIIKRIKKENNRLLDIGCGYGYFLNLAKENGFEEVYGVDISDVTYEFAKKNFNLPVFKGTLKEANFPSDYFDVITCWNTLECVLNPFEELTEINRILKKDGLLCIRVSNGEVHLLLYTLYRLITFIFSFLKLEKKLQKWYIFINYGFSLSTLKKILIETGFYNFKLNLLDISTRLSTKIKIFYYPIIYTLFYFTLKKFSFSSSITIYAFKK